MMHTLFVLFAALLAIVTSGPASRTKSEQISNLATKVPNPEVVEGPNHEQNTIINDLTKQEALISRNKVKDAFGLCSLCYLCQYCPSNHSMVKAEPNMEANHGPNHGLNTITENLGKEDVFNKMENAFDLCILCHLCDFCK